MLLGGFEISIVAGGEFAVLSHADRVLIEGGLHEELAILNTHGRSTIDAWVIHAVLRARNSVLCCRVADVCPEWAWRSIGVCRGLLQIVILFVHLYYLTAVLLTTGFLHGLIYIFLIISHSIA